jgi:hypothetical protein
MAGVSRNILVSAGSETDPRPLYKGDDMLRAGARDAVTQALAPVLLGNIVMVEAVNLFSAP